MRIISPIVLVLLLSSCSLLNKVALDSTASLVLGGSDESLTESDWDHFKQAAPANLKLIEGLWFNDQENMKLLSILIKGYGAYSFAVLETEALSDILDEEENSHLINRALLGYEKAIYYGIKFLELKGINSEEFYSKSFPSVLDERFNQTFGDEDLVSLFYFAQALGSSINLQRTNMQKVGYLNHVKGVMNWACARRPDLERGNCKMFDAIVEASTPSLLGGSQAKAKKKFKAIFLTQKNNLLAKYSYIQFHLIPMMEEENFTVEMEKLRKEISLWYQFVLGNKNKTNRKYSNSRFFNLFNAVAKKRYEILWKKRSDLF